MYLVQSARTLYTDTYAFYLYGEREYFRVVVVRGSLLSFSNDFFLFFSIKNWNQFFPLIYYYNARVRKTARSQYYGFESIDRRMKRFVYSFLVLLIFRWNRVLNRSCILREKAVSE